MTGIIFRGQIGDETGEPVGTIYKCNNKFYTSIDAVKADNGADAVSYTHLVLIIRRLYLNEIHPLSLAILLRYVYQARNKGGMMVYIIK